MKVQFDERDVDLDKVLEAEQMLWEAGVVFDTGADVSGEYVIREWLLDGIGSGYAVYD